MEDNNEIDSLRPDQKKSRIKQLLNKTFTFLKSDKSAAGNFGKVDSDKLTREYPPLSPDESLTPEKDIIVQAWPPKKDK